jgi:hypothetical protein
MPAGTAPGGVSTNDRRHSTNSPFASALAMQTTDANRDTLLTQQWTCTRWQSEGWICEEHPEQPYPHHECTGLGDPSSEQSALGRRRFLI